MKHKNRIEPNKTQHGIMILTTNIDIKRRVEILPTYQSTFSNRDRFGKHRNLKDVRYLIIYLFIIIVLLVSSMVITGKIVVFASHIERYDLNNLYYEIDPVKQINLSSDTNKALIEKYFSNLLVNQHGFRYLLIERIIFREQLSGSSSNKQNISCSTVLVIRNLQVYFDSCFSCGHQRKIALYQLFSDINQFQQPLYIISNQTPNNQKVFFNICSIITSTNLTALQAQISISPTTKSLDKISRTFTTIHRIKTGLTKRPTHGVMKSSAKSTASTISKSKPLTTKYQTSSTVRIFTINTVIPDTFEFLPIRPLLKSIGLRQNFWSNQLVSDSEDNL